MINREHSPRKLLRVVADIFCQNSWGYLECQPDKKMKMNAGFVYYVYCTFKILVGNSFH